MNHTTEPNSALTSHSRISQKNTLGMNLLNQTALAASLAIPDLTNERVGGHAIQHLVQLAERSLLQRWQCNSQTIRTSPIVPIENNYDRLNYPLDGAARDARYTRYVTAQYILRTQTSSAIPDTLAGLKHNQVDDLLLILPGLVYRRDCIDRLHCAEPHQLDLWRIVDNRKQHQMGVDDLIKMIETLMNTMLPNHEWRTVSSPHPYTHSGVQVDVNWHGEWVEVGECGLANNLILTNAGLNHHSGLAMGLGLDRLLMIRKNIPDIRLIRSTDSRVREQMNDLSPYQPVSLMPVLRRDLSLAVDIDLDEEMIGDRIRQLKSISDSIKSITVTAETPYEDLPDNARQRMGIQPNQKNVLLQIVIQDLNKTLTAEEGNDIRNVVYQELHEGSQQEIAMN